MRPESFESFYPVESHGLEIKKTTSKHVGTAINVSRTVRNFNIVTKTR